MQVANLMLSSRLSSCITRLWLDFDSAPVLGVHIEALSELEGQSMALFSAVLHATANSITVLTLGVRRSRLIQGVECAQWELDLPARFCSLETVCVSGVALCNLAIMICERAKASAFLPWEPTYSPSSGAVDDTPVVPWPPQEYTVTDTSGRQRHVSPSRSILPQMELSLDRLSNNDHLVFFAFIRPQPIHLSIRQMSQDWDKPVKDILQMLRDNIDTSRLTTITLRDQADWYEASEEKSAIARAFRLALLEQWRGSGVKLV